MRRDQPVQGVSLVNPNHSPAQQYEKGRVCSYEDCGTVLSRYNSKTECAVHESPTRIRQHRWVDR